MTSAVVVRITIAAAAMAMRAWIRGMVLTSVTAPLPDAGPRHMMKRKRASHGVRDRNGDEVRSLPLVGRAIAFDEIEACLCGLRDLKREDVAIPPPCGQGIGGLRPPSLNRTPMLRIGYASGGDAQHRPEAEAGVVETSGAR